MSLWDKTRTIAQSLYGAQGIIADKSVRDRFAEYEKAGFGHYLVCMAKTQYSFSTDPNLTAAHRRTMSCRSAKSLCRPAPSSSSSSAARS